MLWWVLLLALITVVLAIIGFSTALFVVKILFWVFLALLVISLIVSLITPGRRGIAT